MWTFHLKKVCERFTQKDKRRFPLASKWLLLGGPSLDWNKVLQIEIPYTKMSRQAFCRPPVRHLTVFWIIAALKQQLLQSYTWGQAVFIMWWITTAEVTFSGASKNSDNIWAMKLHVYRTKNTCWMVSCDNWVIASYFENKPLQSRSFWTDMKCSSNQTLWSFPNEISKKL